MPYASSGLSPATSGTTAPFGVRPRGALPRRPTRPLGTFPSPRPVSSSPHCTKTRLVHVSWSARSQNEAKCRFLRSAAREAALFPQGAKAYSASIRLKSLARGPRNVHLTRVRAAPTPKDVHLTPFYAHRCCGRREVCASRGLGDVLPGHTRCKDPGSTRETLSAGGEHGIALARQVDGRCGRGCSRGGQGSPRRARRGDVA